MELEMYSLDEVTADLPEVKNPKGFESGKIAKTGLFSQQIFGPIKSYCCACNRFTYKGRYNRDPICPSCGVEITSNEERRKRRGKIILPFPILNPIFYYIVTSKKSKLKPIILDLLSYKNKYFYDDNGLLTKLTDVTAVPEYSTILSGLDGAISVIEVLVQDDTDGSAEFKYIRDNFDKITVSNVIVIPPDLRPSGNNTTGGVRIIDKINELYSSLIIRSKLIRESPITLSPDTDIYQTSFRHIQMTVIKLYDYVLEKLSKKKGLIRSNILGKRVDFSGRAVISPDPTLKMDQCRVPYWMILEMMKPQLTNYLISRRVCKKPNQAVKMIEECIRNRDPKLFDIVSEYCEGKVCILNRQPTLHRLGVLGFYITIHLGNTIQIHPLICHPYNADFDGDAMAIYLPITQKSVDDVMNKIGIWNNLISQTDITIVPKPNQDIILGIYTATKDNSTTNMREYKGVSMSIGRYLFNKCLPDEHDIITEPLNKNKIMDLLNNLALNYPSQEVMDSLDKIKNLGFMLSTLEGYTLGIDDLYSEELIEVSNQLVGNIEKDLETMNGPEVLSILKSGSYADYIESGARGSWDQIRQLVLARGYVADSKNKIRPHLIRKNLVQGLDQKSFFESCWGARKGLLDTALSTGNTGYLTRQLIYSTVFIELNENLDDCGSTDTLDIVVKDEKMAKTLLWRYLIDVEGNLKQIKRSNYQNIIGKRIKLRSPIYCKSKKICKKCYGGLHNMLHSDQIGVIATQAVGERATQLVLRTFHLGGVAQGSGHDEQQEDIITGMGIANKLFHKPQEVFKDLKDPKDLVMMIFKVFSDYKGIHMVHYETIVSGMMYYNDSLWRLQEKRTELPITWMSVLQIPAKNSWLLACSFSNLRLKLLDGLIANKLDEVNALTDLFKL